MTNARELGFLFGYLEKGAAYPGSLFRGSKGLMPKRAPAPKPKPKVTPKAEPKPMPKATPPKGATPRKQVRGIRREPVGQRPAPAVPPRRAPEPAAVATPEARIGGAQPVVAGGGGQDPYADMARALSAPASAEGARALGQNVGAGQAFVPWNKRLSNLTGVSPKAIDTAASLAGGAGISHLIGNALQDPQEEALRSYLVANPFMYDQLNPYAASMMA